MSPSRNNPTVGRRLARWLAMCCLASAPLHAQALVDFGVEDQGGFLVLAAGSSISLQAKSHVTPVTARMRVRSLSARPLTVTAIEIPNTRFTLARLPNFPVTLNLGEAVEFDVTYTPVNSNRVSTTLGVGYRTEEGPLQASGLALTGIAPEFRLGYAVGEDGNTLPVVNGGVIAFPSTPAGSSLTATLIIANIGSAPGVLDGISLASGQTWRLQALPLFPAGLAVGAEIQVSIRFAPLARGSYEDTLRIELPSGPIQTRLTGTATGAELSYELLTSSGTVSLKPGAPTRLPETPVGGVFNARVRVRNSGDAGAVIGNISILGDFLSLSQVPVPPVAIGVNGLIDFALRYAPTRAGTTTGRLIIGGTVLELELHALGLPAYTFTGVSGTVQELQQHSVGLSLNSTYPLELRGVLTLGFLSDTFAADPALQFSTGGNRVNFTIAAGTRDAIFPTGSNLIRFQTGTVAGTITFTPSFTAEGVDLTPANPAALQLALPASPPRLLNVQISSLTPGSVTFQVNGSTSTRSLQAIEFNFTPVEKPKVNFPETRVSLDVRTAVDTYFRSAESAAFGGLFRATIPFTLSAPGATTVPPLTEIIQAATVTLISEQGRSASNTVQIR